MIKVSLLNTDNTTRIYFETNDMSKEGLDELDELYSCLLGSAPRISGYDGSNRFNIEVLHDTESSNKNS